ncbi:MAG: hypothetical protein R2712_07080 [Vicinamibacterales bacterium]
MPRRPRRRPAATFENNRVVRTLDDLVGALRRFDERWSGGCDARCTADVASYLRDYRSLGRLEWTNRRPSGGTRSSGIPARAARSGRGTAAGTRLLGHEALSADIRAAPRCRSSETTS